MGAFAELLAWRGGLVKARLAGELRVSDGIGFVEFQSDAEMKAALAACDQAISESIELVCNACDLAFAKLGLNVVTDSDHRASKEIH